MKKLFLIGALLALFVGANAQSSIRYPWGAATSTAITDDTLAITLTPTNSMEFVTIDTLTLDAALTVNVTISSSARVGDMLIIEASAATAGATITFGTGITGVANAVTSLKTDAITAIYNGTSYVVISAIQED